MKKTIIAIFALAALVSCRSLIEEWQPVLTGSYAEPAQEKLYSEGDLAEFGFPGTFKTIKELKALRESGPRKMGSKAADSDFWIKAQIVSDDRTGNLYREMFIQDASGAIDLKIGKSSLYSEYSLGQWLYIKCDDLTLGSYEDMPQLGLEADQTSTNEYESSYIDVQTVIDSHIFKGPKDVPVAPRVVTASDISASLNYTSNPGFQGELWGMLVTVKGLVYKDQIFSLLYPNPALPHKSGNPENRVFLSYPQYASEVVPGKDYTWGIKTWSLSAKHYRELLDAGAFDDAVVGSGANRFGTIDMTPVELLSSTSYASKVESFGGDKNIPYKDIMYKYATANYVSHYFTVGGLDIQIRTSGYCKFADDVIPSEIITDHRNIDVTGILTIYQGKAQLCLVNSPEDASNPSVVIK